MTIHDVDTMRNEINIELLLGKKVTGPNNRKIGRIEEITAELREGEAYVTEFHLGSYAVFERLASLTIGRSIIQLLGSWIKKSYAVPWDKLDLSDPAHPKLTCSTTELKHLEN